MFCLLLLLLLFKKTFWTRYQLRVNANIGKTPIDNYIYSFQNKFLKLCQLRWHTNTTQLTYTQQ